MFWRNLLVIIGGAWFVAASAFFHSQPLFSHECVLCLGGLTLVGGLWSIGDEDRRAWRNWLMVLFGLSLTIIALLGGSGRESFQSWINVEAGLMLLGSSLIEALVSLEEDK